MISGRSDIVLSGIEDNLQGADMASLDIPRRPDPSSSPYGEAAGRVYRHPLPVRIWHWINALAIILLLLSGFQIFNAHPRLYIGDTGHHEMSAVLEFDSNHDLAHPESWLKVGSLKIPLALGFGEVEDNPVYGMRTVAFPSWLRLPSIDHLGLGRGWHFLMAWILVLNLTVYLAYILSSRRVTRILLPHRWQLKPRAVLHDLWMHLRLKHPTGAAALHYNLLQKISYVVIIFAVLPIIIATGMTMSNSALSIFPWLIDVFGGRQTARLIHFICAMTLVAFLLVHVSQVFLAGFVREMRSILTGYYDIPPGEKP